MLHGIPVGMLVGLKLAPAWQRKAVTLGAGAEVTPVTEGPGPDISCQCFEDERRMDPIAESSRGGPRKRKWVDVF